MCLEDLFGEGARSTRRREPQKQSYESELTITVDEAYHVTTKKISLNIDGENKHIDIKVPAGILPGKQLKVKADKCGVNCDRIFRGRFFLIDINCQSKRTVP